MTPCFYKAQVLVTSVPNAQASLKQSDAPATWAFDAQAADHPPSVCLSFVCRSAVNSLT